MLSDSYSLIEQAIYVAGFLLVLSIWCALVWLWYARRRTTRCHIRRQSRPAGADRARGIAQRRPQTDPFRTSCTSTIFHRVRSLERFQSFAPG